MTDQTTIPEHYTLLTGATGLVGRYLLKDLLSAGVRLAVVVRDSQRETAEDRVNHICEFWEKELGHRLPRPVCLTGDVREKNLGLSARDIQWVQEHCDSCLHNAAILSFESAPRDQEPWVTNLDGTRNVIECCRDCSIGDFHYVSTAYVCGDREETIRESELETGQGFRNDYEHSKFLAEKLVREADCFEKTTIYRPAVITADSKTGYTNTYHGLHLYLRLMSLLVPQVEPDADGIRRTKISLPMTGEEQRNVVTVDWVSKVMTELFLDPESHGRTFHLSPQSRLTPKTLIEACYKYFNSTGVEFAGHRSRPEDERNPFERNFLGNVGIYTSYDCSDPDFDTANLQRFAGHLPCPAIDEAMVHRFLEFGEEDKWGKRRQKPTEINSPVNRHVSKLRYLARELKGLLSEKATPDVSFELGFDVVGTGGGQWYYTEKLDTVLRGLPLNPAAPIVRIQSCSLWRILCGRHEETESNSLGNVPLDLPSPWSSESGQMSPALMAYVDADRYL